MPSPETFVVLWHRAPHGQKCFCRPPERADELFNLAAPGDTLHKVPAQLAMCNSINEWTSQPLLDLLQVQLANGTFVEVRP